MEFITGNLNLILGAIIAILGVIIATTAWRAEPVLRKLREGLDMYREFKTKKSDEGTTISETEKDQLIEKLGEVLMEAIKLVNVISAWNWIKNLFTKK